MSDSGIQWTSIDAPKSIPPRWRWIGFLIALAVVGALVGFALIEGDKIVRGIASDVVRSAVTSALELPEGQEVDVELGEGLLVFQAITGSIDSVDVRVENAAFGGATGTLLLAIEGVSLDPSAPVDTVTATVELDSDNLSKYAANLSSAPLNSVTLPGEVIAIGADLGGQRVDVALAPSVASGSLLFTPVEVLTGGAAVPIDQIMAGPLASLAGPMLTSSPICVAQFLPASVTVSGAAVVDERLVITATGDDVRLASLGGKGTCEAPAA
jgi:hypothetical protein